MAKGPLTEVQFSVKKLENALKKMAEATKPNITSLKNIAKASTDADKAASKLTKTLIDKKVEEGKAAQVTLQYVKIIQNKIKAEEKSRLAEEKAIKTKAERIKKERDAMHASEASRRRLEEYNLIQQKAKAHQEALRINTERTEKANKKYADVLFSLNKGLSRTQKMLARMIPTYKAYILQTNQASTATKLWTTHLRNGGSAFSVWRSKLLLAAFGVNLFQKSIGNLVKAYGEQEAAERKVAGTLKASMGASGMTLKSIKKLTQELQANGTVGDEVNLQMASLLLTYDQIGKEVFPTTLKAANDMATSLANGIPTVDNLKSSVTMLAKALQDPKRGMAALRKVGFSLGYEQELQVKRFIHLGKTVSAQNVILKAAEKQYGDLAKVIKNSTLGQINSMNMALGDTKEMLGKELAPLFLALAESVKEFAESLTTEGIRQFIGTIKLGAIFLGGYKLAALSASRNLKIMNAAANGAAISVARVTKATKIFNAVAKRMPLFAIASTIATVALPWLKKLAGGYEDSGNAVRDASDKHVEYINKLRGMSEGERADEVNKHNDSISNLSFTYNEIIKMLDGYNEKQEQVANSSFWEKFIGAEGSSMLPNEINVYRNALATLVPTIDLTTDSIDVVIAKSEKYVGTLLDEEQGTKDLIKVIKEYNENLNKTAESNLDKQVATLTQKMQDQLDVVAITNRELKIGADIYDQLQDSMFGSGGKTAVFKWPKYPTKEMKEGLALELAMNSQAKALNLTIAELESSEDKRLVALVKKTKEAVTAQHELNTEMQRQQQITQLTAQLTQESFSAMNAMVDQNIQKINEEKDRDIENVKERSAYIIAQKRGDNAKMKALEKQAMSATLPDRQKFAKQKLALAIGEIGVNTSVAIMKAYKDFGWPMAIPVQALLAGIGLAQASQAIAANPIPKFQSGGLVGGNRHSQGGTTIEAEQGEFVMSRSAVQTAGLDTMNRINQGKGGGTNIVVNISGNVMTEEFTQDQVIPVIKDALRRGEDLEHSHEVVAAGTFGNTINTDWK